MRKTFPSLRSELVAGVLIALVRNKTKIYVVYVTDDCLNIWKSKLRSFVEPQGALQRVGGWGRGGWELFKMWGEGKDSVGEQERMSSRGCVAFVIKFFPAFVTSYILLCPTWLLNNLIIMFVILCYSTFLWRWMLRQLQRISKLSKNIKQYYTSYVTSINTISL